MKTNVLWRGGPIESSHSTGVGEVYGGKCVLEYWTLLEITEEDFDWRAGGV